MKETWTTRDFRLQSGDVLPELTLAYEGYGQLAPGGRNAVLVTHGFTSSQHAAGKYDPSDEAAGWWDGLIGPGKAIDTNRYFVVASNMLGSSYGSTAPASLNPKTGRRYGPDFPAITLRDIVTAQKAMLDGLGVTHLVAVAARRSGATRPSSGRSRSPTRCTAWSLWSPRPAAAAARRRSTHCGRACPPIRRGMAAGTTITAGSSRP